MAGQPEDETAADASDAAPKPDRVAGLIRDRILQDQLHPGMAIRERHLAEELGVSRTPLREAFKILSAEGLVELSPRRGATVAAPKDQEIRELLQLLGGIEGFAGQLACDHVTDETIRQLWALHYEMLAAYLRGDRLAYFHKNQEIHIRLVEASGNRVLIQHHRKLNAQVYRIRYVCNFKTERWDSAIKEHEAFLTALERRDRRVIRDILENHVIKAFDLMQQNEATREGLPRPTVSP